MSDPTRTPGWEPSAFEAVTAPMRLHLPERRAPDLTRTPCGANWIPISGRTLTALLSDERSRWASNPQTLAGQLVSNKCGVATLHLLQTVGRARLELA